MQSRIRLFSQRLDLERRPINYMYISQLLRKLPPLHETLIYWEMDYFLHIIIIIKENDLISTMFELLLVIIFLIGKRLDKNN